MKNQDRNKKNKKYNIGALTGVSVTGFASALFCFLGIAFEIGAPLAWVSGTALIYAAVTTVILVFANRSEKNKFRAGGNVPDSILRESVLGMELPMLICEAASGKIIWYNNKSAVFSDGESLFGKTFDYLFGVSLDKALPEEGECRIVSYGDCYYSVTGRRTGTAEKAFVIVMLEDVTELEQIRESIDGRDMAVMYIIADNLEEIAEYENERYRGASVKISDILTEWIASCDGIIKEYERDKYICFITNEKLRESISRKFDMIEGIRDIRVGDSAIPVTVSAGISNIKGTLAEKEKSARQALEMALQRGGDQVVVRSENSTEFYGGRIRTVQKRTKVRARVLANELLMQMSKASSVMVMGHRFADFDSFGAAVGIARLAMFCGVPVHIVTDLSDRGMDACRGIIKNEKEYSGVLVDRDQAMDLVESDMLLVIVDVNNMAVVELPELVGKCQNTVVIDHHRKTADFEREPVITYIEPSSAAACELVAEMLEQCLPEDMLTVSEANMMLAGISLDTKQFTKNTGTRTFSAALYLRDSGADPVIVQELFRTSLEDFTREAKFRSNVVIYRNRFAVALGDGEGESADRVAAAKAADKLLGVDGVEASFALIKIGDAVHISARSSGQINVQLILEKLRGGGHYDSAGAQVEAESITDALTMLKTAIDEYVENT